MTDDELRGLFAEIRQENAAAHAETRHSTAAALAEMRQENGAAHVETRQGTAAALAEMRQENAAAHVETRQGTAAALAEMRQENAAAHVETRSYIDQKVAENRDFFEMLNEATRHEIGLVAEKVVRVEEKLDNVKSELEERMEHGFADTKAMIKFSHAELDRRIRTLEENQRTLEEN